MGTKRHPGILSHSSSGMPPLSTRCILENETSFNMADRDRFLGLRQEDGENKEAQNSEMRWAFSPCLLCSAMTERSSTTDNTETDITVNVCVRLDGFELSLWGFILHVNIVEISASQCCLQLTCIDDFAIRKSVFQQCGVTAWEMAQKWLLGSM